MQEIPHAPGYTLGSDAFIEPAAGIGFNIEHHYLTVFSHFHEFYELSLVLQGTGVHQTSEGNQRLGRGGAVFVAPGVSHAWELCDDMVVYNCFIRAETARFDLWWMQRDRLLAQLFAPAGVPPRLPTVVELDEEQFSACHERLEAIRLRPSPERGQAYDLGHLLLVLDVVARAAQPDGGVLKTSGAYAPQLVRSAVALLEQDLRHHWTLEALGQELCAGTFHFVRTFGRWMGMPPIAYANRLRAERAAVLLASTDISVAAIGAEVGWPNPSGFGRRFRSQYGMSPRAYRAQSRMSGGKHPRGHIVDREAPRLEPSRDGA